MVRHELLPLRVRFKRLLLRLELIWILVKGQSPVIFRSGYGRAKPILTTGGTAVTNVRDLWHGRAQPNNFRGLVPKGRAHSQQAAKPCLRVSTDLTRKGAAK